MDNFCIFKHLIIFHCTQCNAEVLFIEKRYYLKRYYFNLNQICKHDTEYLEYIGPHLYGYIYG